MVTVSRQIENDQGAHAALRRAHESSYRFPEGFLGFSGAVSVTRSDPEGEISSESGEATIGGPRTTSLDGFASDELRTWAAEEIRSMAGHRWPTPYAEADGKHTLTLDESPENPLGDFIKVHDDRFDSAYRVKDGRISQVIRSMGAMRFTITMQSHREAPDGKTLPEHFTVNYWKDGRLFRSDSYHDTYQNIDDVWVPASRRVITADDNGFTTRELVIERVSLLSEPVASVEEVDMERKGTRAG